MRSRRQGLRDALQPTSPKNCGKAPETRQEAPNGVSLRASRRSQSCQELNFGLLASRAVREYISVALSYQVCGDSFQQL